MNKIINSTSRITVVSQKIVFLLVLFVTAFSCSDKKQQFIELKSKLSEKGYCWTDKNNNVSFQFKDDGVVVSYSVGPLLGPKYDYGKWDFDETTHTLNIAWEGDKQYTTQVREIADDKNSFYTAGEISVHSIRGFNSQLTSFFMLQRVKLLDNRFE